MTAPDLRHVEDRLLEERKRALAEMRRAESEEADGPRRVAGELSRAPFHMADAASDTQDTEMNFSTVERETELIARIDASLRLLHVDPTDFRRCESCGCDISAERLELVPWTRSCARCAREEVGRA